MEAVSGIRVSYYFKFNIILFLDIETLMLTLIN